jgi:hypothetical protein
LTVKKRSTVLKKLDDVELLRDNRALADGHCVVGRKRTRTERGELTCPHLFFAGALER